MFRLFKEFHSLLYQDIIRRKKVTPFIIFAVFLITFVATRSVAYFFPGFHIIFTYHLHHFFIGIALLIATNWVALVGQGKYLMRLCSVGFGIGLGFVVDEIWMMIICGTAGTVCDPRKLYWARFNYDIVILVVIVFLLFLYFKPFWLVFRRRILGIVYKPFRAYHRVEKEIIKRQKAIRKEIKKRL